MLSFTQILLFTQLVNITDHTGDRNEFRFFFLDFLDYREDIDAELLDERFE